MKYDPAITSAARTNLPEDFPSNHRLVQGMLGTYHFSLTNPSIWL